MPTTVNGIGTRYCGRQNLEKSTGVCEHCHRAVDLETYETRLWFCFLYIPLIPLGRKQILDSCPACSWHRAVPHAEWERARTQAIDENAGRLRENQDDPEVGLQMLGTLAGFQKKDEATKLARLLKEQHPEHAGVQFSVGGWLEHVGENDAANESFHRAWELEPDNLEYRRAWGMTLAQQGKLTEGRELLSFVEPPSENYDPATLFFLARQCQEQGDHDQALEIFAEVLEATPELGSDKEVRRLVKESESATAREESILPNRSIFRSAPFWWTAATVLLVAGVIGASLLFAANRTVHVVNGSLVPLTVSVDQGSPMQVPSMSKREITLAEGKHTWKVTEAEEMANKGVFVMQTGFFERLFSSPVFVLDPASTTVTVWEEAQYAVEADDARTQHRFYAGQAFYSFDDVDFAFKPFPASVESDGSEVVRTRVESLLHHPAQVISYVAGDLSPEQQLSFCERHLELHPQSKELLDVYGQLAFRNSDQRRLYDFLKGGLDRRPIELEWHRRYQTAAQQIGKGDPLIAQYDRLLQENPENSAALYLRGRIEPNGDRAEELFDRAIAADETSPFPHYAKCHRLVSLARFDEARDAAERALELRPDNADIGNMYHNIRLALGEYDALEQEEHEVLRESPLNATAHFRLLAVFAAKDKLAEMEQASAEFTQTVRNNLPLDPYDFIPASQRFVAYCNRDYERMLELTRRLENPVQKNNQMIEPLVSLGRFEELADSDVMDSPMQAGFVSLYIALGFMVEGDNEKSDHWMTEAMKDFRKSSPELAQVADVMENRSGEELVEGLHNITLSAGERLLVTLAAAARAEGKAQEELLSLVEKLNFFPGFPNHFVDGVLEHLKG